MKPRTIALLLFAFATIIKAPAQTAPAAAFTLKPIGKPGLLLHFAFATGAYFNGALYSFGEGGGLYKTDLSSGDQTRIGNAVFTTTRLLFGIYGRLYSIENDGSMRQIDPSSGAITVVAAIGTWTNITRVIVVGNSFYAIENGALYYHTALNIRARKQIGESEFYDPGMLLRTDSTLHSISDGNVFKINTGTGKWEKLGKGRLWKNSKAGAVLGNKLYTVETSSLFETSLADGTRKELDATQFEKVKFMFSDSGKLYAITREGMLSEIVIGGN